MDILVAPLALIFERAFGYPRLLLGSIGHPVMWMGALITWLETRLNTGPRRRFNGVVLLILIILVIILFLR